MVTFFGCYLCLLVHTSASHLWLSKDWWHFCSSQLGCVSVCMCMHVCVTGIWFVEATGAVKNATIHRLAPPQQDIIWPKRLVVPRLTSPGIYLVFRFLFINIVNILSAYCVPGTILKCLLVLSFLIFRTILWGRDYCLHFAHKETKPQRNSVIQLMNQIVWNPNLNQIAWFQRVCAFIILTLPSCLECSLDSASLC